MKLSPIFFSGLFVFLPPTLYFLMAVDTAPRYFSLLKGDFVTKSEEVYLYTPG